VRQNGRIVSVATIIAVGVNSDGRREVFGLDIGPSEPETFWVEFLRKLGRRGFRGVKLVVSDAHEGLKTAVTRVLNATWQRCRVHFMRNVLAPAAYDPDADAIAVQFAPEGERMGARRQCGMQAEEGLLLRHRAHTRVSRPSLRRPQPIQNRPRAMPKPTASAGSSACR
jgi:Transposase, Mutator family